MLADDGEHVIVLPSWIMAWGMYVRTLKEDDVSDAQREEFRAKFRKSLDYSAVVVFYKRDKVVRRVLFSDLDIPLDSVRDVSVTHACVHDQSFPSFYTSSWNCSPEISNHIPGWNTFYTEHHPSISGTTITITFVDGNARTFDYTSGAILKTDKVEPSPEPPLDPNDPFGELW